MLLAWRTNLVVPVIITLEDPKRSFLRNLATQIHHNVFYDGDPKLEPKTCSHLVHSPEALWPEIRLPGRAQARPWRKLLPPSQRLFLWVGQGIAKSGRQQ